ncbi:hypothetical protein [Streptomyces sp. NPDC048269]|uniref:hypothetical protein n=1 Tax=Streptomyces sp. NPDC048269 TaxID=3155753 RepID=UPI00341FBC82
MPAPDNSGLVAAALARPAPEWACQGHGTAIKFPWLVTILVWQALLNHGTMKGMWFLLWFFLVPLILILTLACWIDWSARRHSSRIRGETAMGPGHA